MKEYTLNSTTDKEFLSFPRKCYITRRKIESGDTIVICNNCGSIMLKQSWIENDKHCGKCQGATLKDISQQYLKSLDVKVTKVESRRPRAEQNVKANTTFGEYYPRHERAKATASTNTTDRTTNHNQSYARGTDKFPAKRERRNHIGRILLILAIVLIIGGIAFAVDAFASTGDNDRHVNEVTPVANEIANGSIAEEPVLKELTIPNTEENVLAIDNAFVGDELYIDEESPECFYGYISKDCSENEYEFTAPRDGRYQFDLNDMMATATARLIIYDTNEERLLDTYNGSGALGLSANQTYRVFVTHYSGESDFTLDIGIQKPTTDISDSSIIYDQVSFENQRNKYKFTAPVSGRYRFDLTEVNSSVSFRLMIWDDKDNNIVDTYNFGQYVDLNEGETYDIQVRQYSGLGSYCMKIGFQKPSIDITGYTAIKDSVEYEDQENVYYFTAPISGRYRFDITETLATNSYRLMAWDHLENNILDTYNSGAYIDLDKGETYEIQLRHYSGFDNYTLNIGYQKEKTDISGKDLIHDNITFENQENVYKYIPNESKDYSFSLTDYDSNCSFRLIIRDEYKNELVDTYNNEATLTLESGKEYTIKVIQYSGFSNYRLNIE